MASNDPLRQMAQCHEKIAAHLARLDALAAAGDGARAELEAALPAMVRWFETNGLRHRMDEEESLFPRLAARFAGDGELTAGLRALAVEHREEDALVAELAGIALGRAAPASVRDIARRFVAHFRSHMEIEDHVVLPRASRALGPDDLDAIAVEMESRRTETPCA